MERSLRLALPLVLCSGILGVPLAEGAPPISAAQVIELSKTSFAAVVQRMEMFSFQYRHIPSIGSLEEAAALAKLSPLIHKGLDSRFQPAWTDPQWNSAVEESRAAWKETRIRESNEIVRKVLRFGNAYLDGDEALLRYQLQRLTAQINYRSPDRSISWRPLTKQLLIAPGRVNTGDTPSAQYFLKPAVLGMPGMHATSEVTVENLTETSATVVLRRGTSEEFRFEVHKSLQWLPSTVKALIGGKVQSQSAMSWTVIEGVGPFPTAVARAQRKSDQFRLTLTTFLHPSASQTPLPLVTIPPGTLLVDERTQPPARKRIASPADVEEFKELRLGADLEIPKQLLERARDLPGPPDQPGPAPEK